MAHDSYEFGSKAGRVQAPEKSAPLNDLAVLILENDSADFELIQHELLRAGFSARCQRAETENEFILSTVGDVNGIVLERERTADKRNLWSTPNGPV